MSNQISSTPQRLVQWFFRKVPFTTVFFLMLLMMVPSLGIIDIFIDLPPGEQSWQDYLLVWAIAPVVIVPFGLVVDALILVLPEKWK